jgi:hypothetical protein
MEAAYVSTATEAVKRIFEAEHSWMLARIFDREFMRLMLKSTGSK